MTVDIIAVVLVAEIVQHFKPQLIQMHNYTPASGLSIKKDNWMVLNRYRPPLSTVWSLHVLCLRSVAYSLPHSSSGFVESGQSKSIYTLSIFFASNSISFEVSIIFVFFASVYHIHVLDYFGIVRQIVEIYEENQLL